jgi:MFS family permease
MSLGIVFASLALFAQAFAFNYASFIIASIMIGLAMRLTLYDASFAALVEIFGKNARPAISIVTLHGALASSILWPITYYLNTSYGVTTTLALFSISLLFISLPLVWFFMPPKTRHERPEAFHKEGVLPAEKRKKAAWLFAFALTLTSFVFGSLAIHLITFMEGLGVSLVAAVWLASIKGIAQFGGRLVELIWGQKLHPLTIALIAVACVGFSFMALGVHLTLVYVVLYGIGQGLLTIIRGSVPLELFGSKGYGELTGRLTTPSLLIAAFSPLLFGIVLEKYGAYNGLFFLLFISILAIVPFMILLKYSHAPHR